MSAFPSQHWSSIAVIAATAGSVWLYFYTARLNQPQSGASHRPALFVEQPRWQLYDKQGRLDKRLHAERLEQWSDKQGAYLTEPRIQIFDQQQRQWQAQATRGWIDPTDRSILLEQQVVLRREPATAGLVVETERLRLADNGDYIETGDPVVLRKGSWHFNAKGLRAYLGQPQLELLERVRGVHE